MFLVLDDLATPHPGYSESDNLTFLYRHKVTLLVITVAKSYPNRKISARAHHYIITDHAHMLYRIHDIIYLLHICSVLIPYPQGVPD